MSKEERIEKLLKKADTIAARSRKELLKELRAKLKEIKEKNLLPKGYYKTIGKQLELKDPKKVYQTLLGLNADLDIAEAIIDLALENQREQRLIEKANKLLKM